MFVKKGSAIFCEKGHWICVTNKDIQGGDVIKSSCFTNFKNGNLHPIPSTNINDKRYNCTICGSRWVTKNFRLHAK